MIDKFFYVYRLLFARRFFAKFNKFLYNCALRGLGVLNYQDMKVSGEIRFLNYNLKPDYLKKNKYVVFDVGANIGHYTKLIKGIMPSSIVFSFEPHPETFNELSNNCMNYKDVHLFNCALSSQKGFLNLFDYKTRDASSHASLSSEVFEVVYGSKTTSHKVEVSTVDLISKNNDIKYIDFLKIDVEGHELDVLKGASDMIHNNKIRVIQFEFTQLNTTTRLFFRDFWSLLSPKYKIYRLLPSGLLELKSYDPISNEIFGYQNLIAIHKG